MDRSAARRVLAAALVLGVGAEILFDGPALGINVLVASRPSSELDGSFAGAAPLRTSWTCGFRLPPLPPPRPLP